MKINWKKVVGQLVLGFGMLYYFGLGFILGKEVGKLEVYDEQIDHVEKLNDKLDKLKV